MERDFKGIWIPKEIWLSKDLTIMEKLFLVEINSLDNKDGCFASNNYFAEFFVISRQRVSQVVNSLVSKGYMTSEMERKGKNIMKRILRVTLSSKFDTLSNKVDEPVKKMLTPCQINAKDNNTINNTSNTLIRGASPNIKSENELFFESIERDIDSLVDSIFPPEHIDRGKEELMKFWNYWTERNSGGRERWRMEKTFEVRRRLVKWMGNIKIYSNQKSNGKIAG